MDRDAFSGWRALQSLCLLLVLSASALTALAGAKVLFNIPAGDLSHTLQQFAGQANVTVQYAGQPQALSGIHTQALSGEVDPRRALSLLLSGTAVTAQWDGDTVVTLLKTSPPTQPRHFDLDAGDASPMLNEYSRQSDAQVLFDFNLLRSSKTGAVKGTYSANDAIKRMLRGSGLVFDWVNDHTIAVTPKKKGALARLWHSIQKRLTSRGKQHPGEKHEGDPSDAATEIVVAADPASSTPLPPAARVVAVNRDELDRAGVATTQDFLRTRPEMFGGGPNEGTVLSTEQQSNTGLGVGANFRGLGAGATKPLVNGRPMSASGSAAAFADISNIPIGVVDHIELIPEGATALYGADAVGGVINFVLRNHFEGAQSHASTGFAQGHTLGEQQFDHLAGFRLGDASGLVALEYYHRDALLASDRAKANSDLTPFGGSDYDTPFGNPGTLVVGSQTWAIPRGQDGRALTASELQPGVSLHDLNAGSMILPSQERLNAYTRLDLPVTDNTQLFADALLGTRRFTKTASGFTTALTVPTSNPYYVNPTGDSSQPVGVLYGFLQDLGPMRLTGTVNTGNMALGFTHLSDAWNATGLVGYAFEQQHTRIDNLVNIGALDAALADPDRTTAFNPFGDGSSTSPNTLAGIRSQARFVFDSSNWFARVTADGSLFEVPGGVFKLVAGSELRREQLDSASRVSDIPTSQTQSRSIWAGFAELRLPVVGPTNRVPGVDSLALSAAGRLAHCSDVGTSATPSFTATWSPFKSLRVRATDAWVFKPPTLGDLSTVNAGSELTPVPDSRSPTGQSLALVAFGGNADLRPARGRSWSLGMDFTPSLLPGLKVAVTRFDIYLDGGVNALSLNSDVLGDPRFASLVNPDPTPAERTAVCGRGTFYGDLSNCLTSAVPIVDARSLNISRVRTAGYDLAAKYGFSTPAGQFDLGLEGTYVARFAQAFSPATPLTNLVNTDHNPPAHRGRASFDYRWAGWDIAAFVNYTGRYRDIDSVPERSVAAWTTVDAQVSYAIRDAGLRLTASAQNIFGELPPFISNPIGVGWDQENATPYGRQLRFGLQKSW
jgi:outer membrane receptor protein involved in Fe transport